MNRLKKYVVAGMVGVAGLAVWSCDDDENALPPIDGYNNSDEVAAENLLAHWSFDDTYNERKSSTAPTTTLGAVGFAEGQIGKALQLTKGALSYPSISAINSVDALSNFTVSLWVNTTNQKKVVGGGFQSFFGIIPTNTDFWGNIQACAETGWYLPSSDTLALKNYMNTTLPDGSQSGQDNIAVKNTSTGEVDSGKGAHFMGAKRWAHYVMTWNSTTHEFEIYGDAQAVGGYPTRGTTPAMKMRVPAKAVFGSMASSDLGFPSANRPDWSPLATALIDDVRVYNTVLSQAEITALFNLGTAGR
jgi:hypothetical protein